MKQRIYQKKSNQLREEDWLAICTLLIKAGYTVRRGVEKINNTTVKFIEYWME